MSRYKQRNGVMYLRAFSKRNQVSEICVQPTLFYRTFLQIGGIGGVINDFIDFIHINFWNNLFCITTNYSTLSTGIFEVNSSAKTNFAYLAAF